MYYGHFLSEIKLDWLIDWINDYELMKRGGYELQPRSGYVS